MRDFYGFFATPQRAITYWYVIVACFGLSISPSLAQPVFMGFPNDVTVECDQIPDKIAPMAGSNCLPMLPIALSEHEIIGACPQTKIIDRVWTATDNCGKTLQQTQRITIRDTKAPTITFTKHELLGKKNGDTLVLDCRYAYGLGTDDVAVVDNCDNSPKVIFKDNLIRAGNCAVDKYLLFMNCSWIATDACGNKTEVSVYIKFIDITPPDLWGQPANVTVACEGQADFSKKPYFKDFCDGQPTLREEKNVTIGSCAGQFLITRSWIATDVCGNSASISQGITVKDTIPPIITSKPKDVTIQQGDLIPLPGIVTAKDNCNQPTIQKLSEKWTALNCDSLLTRTWDVIDACGNSTPVIQKITMLTKKPNAGKFVADSTTICLQNNLAKITVKETIKPTLPIGYKIIYVLSNKNNTITQSSNTPIFDVSQTGQYAVHALVFDTRFDVNFIKKDTTSITQLSQKLAGLCAAFDESGAQTKVKVCNIIPTDTLCVKPLITTIIVRKTDCDSTNGSIEIHTTPSNVNFEWKNNPSKTNSISNVGAGVYTVKISQVADKECFIEKTIILDAKNDYVIAAPTVLPSACGKTSGEVIFPDTTYNYRWSDGKITPSRTGLAVGTYYITVTKDSSTCQKIILIDIKETSLLTAEVEILQRPTCGGNDGVAEIIVEGGSGDYKFSWGNTAKRNDLTAGVYSVTVTDNQSNCAAIVDFVLTNSNLDSAAIITTLSNNNCANDLVKLKIDVHLPVSVPVPPTIRVVDTQNKVHNPNALAAGIYYILVYDANECLIGTTKIDVVLPKPIEVNLSIYEALCRGNIKLEVNGGTTPYTYDWADIQGTDNQKDRIDIKAGKYALTITDNKGCNVFLKPEISDKTCEDTCINWIPERNLSISTKDCAEGAKWCLPIPVAIFKTKISTLQNGKPYAGQVADCRQSPLDSIVYAQIILPVGKHTMVFIQTRGKSICRDTVQVQVFCDNCPTIYAGASSVNADSCGGTAKICLDVKPQYLAQVKITEKGKPYTDPIGVCSNGNAQLTLKPGQYDFTFYDSSWMCIKTLKLDVRCDTLKNTAVNSLVLEKSICVGDTFVYCLDTLELNKGPFTVSNLCPNTYKAIQFSIKDLCVKIQGDTLGTESICLYVCDPYKRCDTTYIVVNVIPKPDPKHKVDTIYREVKLTQSDTVCISTKSLGQVDTIYNYCANASGTAVRFSLTANKACIKYDGLAVGVEKGCFVVCDKTTGKCDTTIVFVKVKKDSIIVNPPDPTKIPIAVKDRESTILETSVVINLLANDSIRGTLKQMKVYQAAKYGDTYYTQSNQGQPAVTYIPRANICNVIDTFAYFIENEHGRDSAIVCIGITCQKLIIFSGFSPNADNNNDVFTILGIEEHPDNVVTIYNRWGNRIFEKDSYTNTDGWNGTWDGRELPDGTYYYHITLPRLGKVYTGFVEMKR